MAGAWWRLGAVATAFALGMAAHAVAAQDRDAVCNGVGCLAHELVDGIPDGETIALIPLRAPVTNLPVRDADNLYDELYRAMSDASAGRHDFVRRDRMYDEIWESSKWELSRSNYQDYVDALRAGVVVQCKDRGLRGGMVALSCTAAGVGNRSALQGRMLASLAIVPVERRLFQYDYVLSRLGNTLAAGADEPKDLQKTFIVYGEAGQRSALTEEIGRKLGYAIRNRFADRRYEDRQQREFKEAIGRGGDEPAPPPRGYELRGAFTWIDRKAEAATLWVELLDGRDVVAHDSATIERSWLPESLAGADVGGRRYRAEARAVPSGDLSKDGVSDAAKNLARARVVAKALDMAAPAFEEIGSEAESMAALRFLAHGIPVDEQFDTWPSAGGEWSARLTARVVAVGTVLRPTVEAALSGDEFRAREPIGIELSASDSVYTAVFSWGADNRVVRLYPNMGAPELIVPAGGRVGLPRAGDGKIQSMPLPGRLANHEAFIVVASTRPLDFGGVAPLVGQSLDETMKNAGEPGLFLDALGALDLTHATVSVLPYRIRK